MASTPSRSWVPQRVQEACSVCRSQRGTELNEPSLNNAALLYRPILNKCLETRAAEMNFLGLPHASNLGSHPLDIVGVVRQKARQFL